MLIVGLFVRLVPPMSITAIPPFCVSIVLGFAVLWAISTIVQMTAFWIVNVWSIATIKNVVVNVLSGAFLPLWRSLWLGLLRHRRRHPMLSGRQAYEKRSTLGGFSFTEEAAIRPAGACNISFPCVETARGAQKASQVSGSYAD